MSRVPNARLRAERGHDGSVAALSPAIAKEAGWIDKSNAHAQVVLDVFAEFSPEGAGSLGVDGLDEQILDLGPGIHERNVAASEKVLAELERRLENETDTRVRQDIEILSKALRDNIRTSKLNYDQLLPYYNISQTVFFGVTLNLFEFHIIQHFTQGIRIKLFRLFARITTGR